MPATKFVKIEHAFSITIASTKIHQTPMPTSTAKFQTTKNNGHYTKIPYNLNHCFTEAYFCIDMDDPKNHVYTKDLVKDAYVCQKICQDIASILDCKKFTTYPESSINCRPNEDTTPWECKMFSWDSITYNCTLAQDCDLVYSSYHVTGPRNCPET